MKKYPRFLLWFIVVLSLVAIFFTIPQSLKLSFDTPNLPIINRKISIDKDLSFLNNPIYIGSLRIQNTLEFRKGLDLAGGTSITLQADMKDIASDQRDAALQSAKTVIERRVDLFGVSEPIIQTSKANDSYRIIVELPGVTNVDEAVARIGKTAKLEFRGVENLASNAASLALEDTIPLGLSGADLQRAQPAFDENTGAPVVQFDIKSESQTKFYDTTQQLVGKKMAMCLDDVCFSAPTVQQAIRDSGRITGGFTTEQTKYLADQLNAGALPVSLSVLEQRTISATLGEESLQKSLIAAFLGFIVIVMFMCLLYGRLGAIASVALILYTLFVLSIFKLSTLTPYGVTLSLAGIAGFVLSIGMAVDANILIFERMKEELRRGKPKEAALELGFSRAWSSIRDSNVSSIITSLILMQFGSGIVRGFAVTLLIGVLVSMFSAIVVTKTFLRLIYR